MKFIFTAFLLAMSILPVRAQDSLSSNTRRVVDASLDALNMRRSDLSMPWDAVAPDPFRTELEKQLFARPLYSFDVLTRHAGLARRLSPDNADEYMSRIVQALDLGPYRHFSRDQAMNGKAVADALGTNLDSAAGFIASMTLRQFLIPMIMAWQNTEAPLKEFRERAILSEYIDSLLLMSEENSSASLFEMKAQERRSDSVAKLFFSSAESMRAPEYYNELLALYRSLLTAAYNIRNSGELLRDSIGKTIILRTKFGRIAVGGPGDDLYEGDFFLILDAGGNDSYLRKGFSKAEAMKAPLRAIIDLGGNDLYSGDDYSYAAGFFGGNYLIDLAGDDSYSAGNFSLGAGVFGVGVLHDMAGTDMYSGKVFTQGSAAFGMGLLIDEAGNDLYRAYANAQGFGFTRGYGAIADYNGNDSYTTTSPFVDVLRYDNHFVAFTQGASLGQRPIASGGVGFLFDYKGNDSYSTDIYGQGTAYWFGLGGLYDVEGDDRYSAYQYAQGSGVHLAQGVLLDRRGEDIYTSHGVSQGCGHDIAFGGLVDESGNDHYFVESLSLGAGNANAVSLFADEKGDDSYIALNQANTMGFSDFRRNYGMVGIFADGGGRDLYGETTRNGRIASKSSYGIFADHDIVKDKVAPAAPSAPAEGGRMPLESDLERLFIQASAAAQKFQYNVGPAQDKIVGMGKGAIPFLSRKFSTESARERLALENILPKLYDAEPALKQVLIDSLNSQSTLTLGIVATAAGKRKIREALPFLVNLTNSENWRIRAMAAQQIGEIGEKGAADSLVKLLSDAEPYVRARAAFAIGQINPPGVEGMLREALRDTAQVVRNNAVQGLKKNTLPMELVRGLFADAPEHAKISLLKLLPAVSDKKASKDFLGKMPAGIRNYATRDEELVSIFFPEGVGKTRKGN